MGHPSDPAGLLGCNCRHSFYPFWVGVSEPNEREPEPVAYNDREYTYYEATQKQRAMERDPREQGRVKNALAAQGENVRGSESLIRQKKDEYERFSKAMDIRPKWERCWVPGDKEVDWERVIGAGKTMSVHSGYKPLQGYDFDAQINVNISKEVRELVDGASQKVCKLIPKLDDYLDAVGYGNSEDAHNPAAVDFVITKEGRVGQILSLNRSMWDDLKKVEDLVKRETETGGHIASDSVEAIITHEYGHVAYNSAILQKMGYNRGAALTRLQRMSFELCKSTIDDNVLRTIAKHPSETLSQRAMLDCSEKAAEAFSEFFSGKASGLSSEVVGYFMEVLR